MLSSRFFLNKPSEDKPTLILLRILYNGKRIKLSTGEAIHPKFWNSERQEVRRLYPSSMEINSLLKSMKSEIESIVRESLANKRPLSAQFIKEKFRAAFQRGVRSDSFYDLFDLFIDTGKTTKVSGVIRSYISTKKRIQEFEEDTGYEINFVTMDNGFYDKFLKYLIEKRNITNNTIGTHFKIIKTFLNWAENAGYNHNPAFHKFKVFKEEAYDIYLTEEEIRRLEELDLSGRKSMEKIRDAFLLQCYTGLRFSDLKNLKPENLKDDHITLGSIKTKERLIIPLSSRARQIIERYPDLNFNLPGNQAMNAALKEMAQLAGIIDSEQVVTYQGSNRIEKTFPKYRLIGTHTARRTFITLSLEKGMRIEIVMKISGHKSMSSFKKYIKLTDRVITSEMEKGWG